LTRAQGLALLQLVAAKDIVVLACCRVADAFGSATAAATTNNDSSGTPAGGYLLSVLKAVAENLQVYIYACL
jgi:hypothetical protein